MTMFFLAYYVVFFRTGTFCEKLLLLVNTSAGQLLLQSNQFYKTVTFLKQLLFLSRYFFTTLTSSQELFFKKNIWSKTSTNQLLLESRQFFKAASFSEQLPFKKTNIDIYRRTYFSKQTFLRNIKFLFNKVTSSKEVPFQETFFQSNFFLKRAPFLQYNISEEVLFHSFALSTATLPIYQLVIKGIARQPQEIFCWISYSPKLQHLQSLFNLVVTPSIAPDDTQYSGKIC